MKTFLLALALVAPTSQSSTSSMTPDELADAYAQAILSSHDADEANRRLRQVTPDLPDRSHALPVLFDRIARGGAGDSHWAALCRVDKWGDGAWPLEMEGAAFDGLAANPGAFSRRYLEGDDCALLLLQYAYAWSLEAASVGFIGCSADGRSEAERFIRVVRESLDVIRRLRPANGDSSEIRLNILKYVASAIDESLRPTLRRFQESCPKEPR